MIKAILLIPCAIAMYLWGKQTIKHYKKNEGDLMIAAMGILMTLCVIAVIVIMAKVNAPVTLHN